MQIVTDSGTDVSFTPEQLKQYRVHVVPLTVTLGEKSYREGIDIEPDAFYQLLDETGMLPLTSQPAVGEFAALYRQLAQSDPEILSIHISSGLSGTADSARAAAAMVPEANVTVVDTKTLSVPSGWQVEAAARAAAAGWSREKILEMVARIGGATDVLYTLKELKYLIHGGRISHISGLVASLLNIKPIIGVDKQNGKYYQVGKFISINRALQGMLNQIEQWYGAKTRLRVQLLHGNNLEAVEQLRQKLSAAFDCVFDPVLPIAPVLGAHTGPTMVGLSVGPAALFSELP